MMKFKKKNLKISVTTSGGSLCSNQLVVFVVLPTRMLPTGKLQSALWRTSKAKLTLAEGRFSLLLPYFLHFYLLTVINNYINTVTINQQIA